MTPRERAEKIVIGQPHRSTNRDLVLGIESAIAEAVQAEQTQCMKDMCPYCAQGLPEYPDANGIVYHKKTTGNGYLDCKCKAQLIRARGAKHD